MLPDNSIKKVSKNNGTKNSFKDKSELINSTSKYGKLASKNGIEKKPSSQNSKKHDLSNSINQCINSKTNSSIVVSQFSQKPHYQIPFKYLIPLKGENSVEKPSSKSKDLDNEKESKLTSSPSRIIDNSYYYMGFKSSTATMFSKYSKTNLLKTISSNQMNKTLSKRIYNSPEIEDKTFRNTSFLKDIDLKMGSLNIHSKKTCTIRSNSQPKKSRTINNVDFIDKKSASMKLSLSMTKQMKIKNQPSFLHSIKESVHNKSGKSSKMKPNNSMVISSSRMKDDVFSSIINEYFLKPIPILKNKESKRLIKNIYELSKTGFAGQNKKKINQDNYFVYKNFNNNKNSVFFGVCDGHGPYGHEVSHYLKETLPKYLDSEIIKRSKFTATKNIIMDTFKTVNYKLKFESEIETSVSGSTCNSVIYTPEKLTICNVGDSRTVLAKFVNGMWKSYNLSRDHKPEEKVEMERIKSCRGRVEAYRDINGIHVGPQRVWLYNGDLPGLAMSRSFGDQIASSVGVICEPEITVWDLTKDDMFLITGSDGVFEFMNSQEIVELVKNYYLKNDIKGCAEFLIEESSKRWMREEEIIDDITVIIVFFE